MLLQVIRDYQIMQHLMQEANAWRQYISYWIKKLPHWYSRCFLKKIQQHLGPTVNCFKGDWMKPIFVCVQKFKNQEQWSQRPLRLIAL